MRKLSVLAVTMTFTLVGCGKKDAKLPPAAPGDTNTPQQSSKNGPPGGIQPSGGGGSSSSGGGVAIVPAGGVGVVMTAGGGGGGGGGAAQAVRKAARRAASMNELKNLAETIETMRDPFGKMPTKDAILAEAKRSLPKIYEGLTEGAYVLSGTADGAGLWAYEANADTQAGLTVIGGRVQRSTPDDLRPFFAVNPPPVPPMPPAQPAAALPAMTKDDMEAEFVVRRQVDRAAALPAVTKDDMEAIFTFVDNASGASGKMPSGMDVYNALLAAKPSTAALVQQRAIFILQPAQRESVWAMEAKATTQGGMIVTNNGVETVTADEAKKRTKP